MSDQNGNERELRADTDTEVLRFSSVIASIRDVPFSGRCWAHGLSHPKRGRGQTCVSERESSDQAVGLVVSLSKIEYGERGRNRNSATRVTRVVWRQQVVAAFMERGDSLSNRVAQASAASRSERLWWVGARDGRVWKLPRAWLTRRRIAKVREVRSPEVDVSPAGVKAAALNAAA
jgi:hypothetical protein